MYMFAVLIQYRLEALPKNFYVYTSHSRTWGEVTEVENRFKTPPIPNLPPPPPTNINL